MKMLESKQRYKESEDAGKQPEMQDDQKVPVSESFEVIDTRLMMELKLTMP